MVASLRIIALSSINRIRLEFKGEQVAESKTPLTGINRIRLEFKAICDMDRTKIVACINRIRLEFKVFSGYQQNNTDQVLIESDWNLKLK